MNPILESTYELNNPPCISETLDNNAVIIDLDSGSYHNMLGFSGQIWSLLSSAHSPNNILDAITSTENKAAFEVQLADFIASLCEKNILRTAVSRNSDAIASFSLPNECSLSVETYSDMQELLALDPIHDSDEAVGWPKAKVSA